MGLDSFWVPSLLSKAGPPKFDPPLNLCGGLMSESGEGSFRGKVYDSIISAVSGRTLYDEEISTEEVREIAIALEGYKPEKSDYDEHNICPQEYNDLKRMFRGYADAGYVLQGWW